MRDNAIKEIDVKGVEDSKLESCGSVILAHCLKSNSSVTVVEASNCGMGTAGAKAFGDVLRVNKTLRHLNVSNNSFGKMQVGDQVKVSNNSFGRPVVGDTVTSKVNGEVKTVRRVYSDGIDVESSLSSQGLFVIDAD